MIQPRLTPQLQQLEDELHAHRAAGPPAELQQRIVGQLDVQLSRSRADAGWSFAAAVAAVTLVCMNLSLAVASNSNYGFGPTVDKQQVAAAAAQIKELLPALTHRQAMAYAVTLQSGSNLPKSATPPILPLSRRSMDLSAELDF